MKSLRSFKTSGFVTSIAVLVLLAVLGVEARRPSEPHNMAFGLPCKRRDDALASAKPKIPVGMNLLLLSAGIFAIAPAYAADSDVARGKALFDGNCAACHVGGGNVVNEKRTLQRAPLEQYFGLEPDRVQAFVQGSMVHKMMIFPNVPGGKLSDDNFSDVVSYIVDQAAGDKW